MVCSRILLFFYGTAIVSSRVLRNEMLGEHQPMAFSTPGLPSFTPPFFQQGTNLIYKPQFVMPGMAIPPPITNIIQKEDYQEQHRPVPDPQEVILPASMSEPIETKPMDIPQPPELPPLVMTQIPIAVFEEPEISVSQPLVVAEPTESLKPIEIPQPPELPPLSLSELPSPITIEIPNRVPEVIEIAALQPVLIKIPEAPILPAFTMPEVPAPNVLPTVSEISQIEDVQPAVESKPNLIPDAPTLPPSTISKLPAIVEISSSEDCEKSTESQPISIPEAPILPSFIMPELSAPGVISEIPSTAPELIQIPEAPVLPPLSMSVLPSPIITQAIAVTPESDDIQSIPEFKPIDIPEAPVLLENDEPSLETSNPVIVESNDIPTPMKPIDIPAPPELPPFNIPITSVSVGQSPAIIPIASLPSLEDSTMSEIMEFNPVNIPEAPQLPPLIMPNLPTVAIITPGPNEEQATPLMEIPPAPVLPAFDNKPFIITSAPEPPPLILSAEPNSVFVEVQSEQEPCLDNEVAPGNSVDQPPSGQAGPTTYISELPIPSNSQTHFPYPTFWAQNIIIERVFPNMIQKDCAKCLEQGLIPVVTKPYFVPSE